MKILPTLLLALVFVASLGSIAFAQDYQKGMRAFESGSYIEALDEWRPLAEQGNAVAQYNLGYMYDRNLGVLADPKNCSEAVRWYRLAANQGYAGAQYQLGVKYDGSWCTAPDDTKAVKWYRLAANQGVADAQYQLGTKYNDGLGVRQDFSKAVKWYQLAANQRVVGAQYQLGEKYMFGEGIRQDYAKAAEWFRLAAEQGHGIAQYNMGQLLRRGLGVGQSYEQAAYWYLAAAGNGPKYEESSINARFNLAMMHMLGDGVEKNNILALMWLVTVRTWHLEADKWIDEIIKKLSIKDRDKGWLLGGVCETHSYKDCASWLHKL